MNSFAFKAKTQTALEDLIANLIPEDVNAVVDYVTTSSGKKYMLVETTLSAIDVSQIHRDMAMRDEVAFAELP